MRIEPGFDGSAVEVRASFPQYRVLGLADEDDDQESQPEPEWIPSRGDRWRSRNKWRSLMLVLLLVVIACSLAVTFFAQRGDSTSGSKAVIAPPTDLFAPPSSTTSTINNSVLRTIILTPNTSLKRGDIVQSPNGRFQFVFEKNRLALVQDERFVLWEEQVVGDKLFLQSDGNVVLRTSNGRATWRTHTSGNPGSFLILNDAGQLAVLSNDSFALWLTGVPQGQYGSFGRASPSFENNLEFPIRAIFYYPWYTPSNWKVNGKPIHHTPSLGFYHSGDRQVVESHVQAIEYANMDLSIVSWWGRDRHSDRARITNLMSESTSSSSSQRQQQQQRAVKWSVYYELDASAPAHELRANLDYLKKWFAWHPNWAHVNGKPVIFVYLSNSCNDVRRWKAASSGEWFVVLKLFRRYMNCPDQPDSWHEYGPRTAITHHQGSSYGVSPGFWLAYQEQAALKRLSIDSWRRNVQNMIASGEKWQLITTFNEFGEATAVESAKEWASASGYGQYLDVLHDELATKPARNPSSSDDDTSLKAPPANQPAPTNDNMFPTGSPYMPSNPTTTISKPFSEQSTKPPSAVDTFPSRSPPNAIPPTNAPPRGTLAPTAGPAVPVAVPVLTTTTINQSVPRTVVMTSNSNLSRGATVWSPNGNYQFVFETNRLAVLDSRRATVWQADASGDKLFLQSDGNLILRQSGSAQWRTNTNGRPNSALILNDAGQLAILSRDGVALWLAGVPQGSHSSSSSASSTGSLHFPIRASFYYPWYTGINWRVNGVNVHQTPSLGFYRSDDAQVVQYHVKALEHARIDLSIASWWGPDRHSDRARITNLMSQSRTLKWSVYYELDADRPALELRSNLDYLKRWFTWHPNWAHVNGKPVIFVYLSSSCEDAVQWMMASGGEWFVVLKQFPDFLECEVQPDSWHDYDPINAVTHHRGFTYGLSPGFWKADEPVASLKRLSAEAWREYVQDMIESGEPWQLITTFNGFGEGTAVESAREWASASGYGLYIDILHDPSAPTNRPPTANSIPELPTITSPTAPKASPTASPTTAVVAPAPTYAPIFSDTPPTNSWDAPPTNLPPFGGTNSASPTSTINKAVKATTVLSPNGRLSRGDSVQSPNGVFRFVFQNNRLALLQNERTVLWEVKAAGDKLFMQTDGNLILRQTFVPRWRTHTSGNPDASFVLNDAGQLAILSRDGVALWLAGVPQGEYVSSGRASNRFENLQFPVRAAFYYPWYSGKNWSVNGSRVHHTPSLGFYRCDNPEVVRAHVDALEYAHVDLAIASWWGADKLLDRARITNLMARSRSLKWSVYYELDASRPSNELRANLDYLKKWFAWHPNWAHVNGKPVIFVYLSNSCDDVQRWKAASAGEWFVVLKLFRGYKDCQVQPDSWHEYGPLTAITHHKGSSYGVSPGFWHAPDRQASLKRLSTIEWRENVQKMIASREPWQLITTFNEFNEGTAVESAKEWASASGYGKYIDVLHELR